jgi:hypothetical protein
MKKVLKVFIVLCLMVSLTSIALSASLDGKVDYLPIEESEKILPALSGADLWLDKNSQFMVIEWEIFEKANNLDHYKVGIVDVKQGIIELINDKGEKFLWKPLMVTHLCDTPAQATLRQFRRAFYLTNPEELFPDWTEKVWDSIKQQKVYIGMDKEMCILSWGIPKRINRTTHSWGVREQWVYGESYLYFENDKLTAIQN